LQGPRKSGGTRTEWVCSMLMMVIYW